VSKRIDPADFAGWIRDVERRLAALEHPAQDPQLAALTEQVTVLNAQVATLAAAVAAL
jgi:hypothetical protein